VSWEAKRPSNPLFKLLPWALALAAFLGTVLLFRTSRPQAEVIGALLGSAEPVPSLVTGAVEKSWMDGQFPEEERYLLAPPGPPPCPWGVEGVEPARAKGVQEAIEMGPGGIPRLRELHQQNSGWLTGLALGRLWIDQNELTKAEGLYETLLTRRTNREKIELAQLAVRENRPLTGPATPDLTAMIYLLQASGYVQILNNRSGDKIWWTLRSPLACGKVIYARENQSLIDKVVEEGYDLSLPPPGCVAAEWPSISSFDLYNNLIVAYLRTRGLHDSPENRKREFVRGYKDPPDKNPLFTILQKEMAEIDQNPEGESWVWAISNAERLLRDRLRARADGYPKSARLGLTVASLMESAVERTPPEALPALLRQERELLRIARTERDEVGPAQYAAFDRGLARLLVVTASRDGREADLDEQIAASLSPEQGSAIALVRLAQSRRKDPAVWAALALEGPDQEVVEKLGKRIEAWRAASRSDLAAAVARLGIGEDKVTQRRLLDTADAILELRDTVPPELSALRDQVGISWRIWSLLRSRIGAWLFAAGIAFVAWLLGVWLALQLRLRKELFTSFYRSEVEQRLRELP